MIRTLTLTSVILAAGWTAAQSPEKNEKSSPFGGASSKLKSYQAKKSALESSIELALANNPDLRVAEAKVREAEAILSRTRLQVLQKVVAAYHAIDQARAAVKQAEAYMERVNKLGATSAISQVEVDKANAALAAAKAALASAQAELDYLQGKVTTKGRTWSSSASAIYEVPFENTETPPLFGSLTRPSLNMAGPITPPRGASADKLRKALGTKVSFRFVDEPAQTLIARLRKEMPDVHIQVWSGVRISDKISVDLTDVPLSAALQLLEDALSDARVFVRDYGLLITSSTRVPAGAPSLAEFLRAGTGTTTEAKPSK